MTFSEQMKADVAQIEAALAQYLSRETGEGYDRIFEAAKYSALAGGKRLRPVIVLANLPAAPVRLVRRLKQLPLMAKRSLCAAPRRLLLPKTENKRCCNLIDANTARIKRAVTTVWLPAAPMCPSVNSV